MIGTLELNPLSAGFGIEARGVDLVEPLPEAAPVAPDGGVSTPGVADADGLAPRGVSRRRMFAVFPAIT